MTQKIFFAKGDSPEMIKAFTDAQNTFKYLWRELSWEYRRIVPALEVACVKVAFTEHIDDAEEPIKPQKPIKEKRLWILQNC